MTAKPDAHPIIVQKFGGSSVGTPERLGAVADRIVRSLENHPRLVVVVSAMGKTTDQLVALAHQVARYPHGREFDLLLAAGEQIAISALGLALQDRGVPAVALTAAQGRIKTDDSFNRARIRSIDTHRVLKELRAGKVVIIAGFQGVTEEEDVTTLGRGGGDITGAAIAAALKASVCEILTDVDGVFSADPSVVRGATLVREISFAEAIELAASGAKVLHPRAAEICMQFGVPIHVRSSFHDRPGTLICGEANTMEEAAVVGVSVDTNICKVTLSGVPNRPGYAARIFQDLADAAVNVRLIIQAPEAEARTHITFVLENELVPAATAVFERWKEERVVTACT